MSMIQRGDGGFDRYRPSGDLHHVALGPVGDGLREAVRRSGGDLDLYHFTVEDVAAIAALNAKNFYSLAFEVREAFLSWAFRHGLLDEITHPYAQLGYYVREPGFGGRIEPILTEIREQALRSMGQAVKAEMAPAVVVPKKEATQPDPPLEPETPVDVEKLLQQLKLLDNAAFTDMVELFLLPQPHPHLEPIVKMAIERGQTVLEDLWESFFRQAWIPSELKKQLWYAICRHNSGSHLPASFESYKKVMLDQERLHGETMTDVVETYLVKLPNLKIDGEDMRTYAPYNGRRVCEIMADRFGLFVHGIQKRENALQEFDLALGGGDPLPDCIADSVRSRARIRLKEVQIETAAWWNLRVNAHDFAMFDGGRLHELGLNVHEYYVLIMAENCPSPLREKAVEAFMNCMPITQFTEIERSDTLKILELCADVSPQSIPKLIGKILEKAYAQTFRINDCENPRDIAKREYAIDFLMKLFDFTVDAKLRKTIGEKLLTFRPSDTILRQLECDVPKLKDRIALLYGSLDEQLRRLTQQNPGKISQ